MARRNLRIEDKHQEAFVFWFKVQYPLFSDCLYMNANGAHLAGSKESRARAMHNMKKQGFKNGVTDLTLSIPNDKYHGLLIEMKKPGSTISSVSEDQRKHIVLMNLMGYYATYCTSFDEAKSLTMAYMLTTKKIKEAIEYSKIEKINAAKFKEYLNKIPLL